MAKLVKTYDENMHLTGTADMPSVPEMPLIKKYSLIKNEDGWNIDIEAVMADLKAGYLLYADAEITDKEGTHNVYNGIINMSYTDENAYIIYFIDGEVGSRVLAEV